MIVHLYICMHRRTVDLKKRETTIVSFNPIVPRSWDESPVWHQVEGRTEPSLCVSLPDGWELTEVYGIVNVAAPKTVQNVVEGIERDYIDAETLLSLAKKRSYGIEIIPCETAPASDRETQLNMFAGSKEAVREREQPKGILEIVGKVVA